VDVSTPANFIEWEDKQENMWMVQGLEEGMSYVNLQMYPEANTAYDGRNIWDKVYNENCFKGTIDSMCLEERVFYRLISGLHASINIHIGRHYEYDFEMQQWIGNHSIFHERVGKHPDRIKNLYFAFLFLLRAVHKVAPALQAYDYKTGNPQEDAKVKDLVQQLLQVKLLCSPNFDESLLFSAPEKEAIKQQFKQHFRNISMITNCITCEKCKVYAKVQTTAIGTALKILFGGPQSADASRIARQLQRNEIIALINTLRQFSNSIESIKFFQGEDVPSLNQAPILRALPHHNHPATTPGKRPSAIPHAAPSGLAALQSLLAFPLLSLAVAIILWKVLGNRRSTTFSVEEKEQ